MAPICYLMGEILWLKKMMMLMLLIMTIAGKEALRLMTQPDGTALCAVDPPTVRAAMSPAMSGAPEPVRCGMTCAVDAGCKQFNYVSTQPVQPCQLYHYRPTNFDVVPNCRHYHEPGQRREFVDAATARLS